MKAYWKIIGVAVLALVVGMYLGKKKAEKAAAPTE